MSNMYDFLAKVDSERLSFESTSTSLIVDFIMAPKALLVPENSQRLAHTRE